MTIIHPISCYSDLGAYHTAEEEHAFYKEMREEILSRIRQYQQEYVEEISVLEIGAGTGLLTQKLLTISGIQLAVLEPDERSLPLLKAITDSHDICLLQKPAEQMDEQERYNIIVSSFSHDHVQNGAQLAERLSATLKPNGIYIAGLEMLRPYTSDEERIAALHDWHGYVIADAQKRGIPKLAALEAEALESGIHKIADFKRDETRLEKEMYDAGFTLIQKKKIGPFIPTYIGGVFVYLFQKI